MTLPSDQPLQAGSLGRYNLIASLGQGGMADVYLAVVGGPGSFSKLMVIKALRRDVQTAPEFIQMFLDEARLSARFNHPNIVQTYEVGEIDGAYFIAMEYLDGQTLRAVQRKLVGALPLEEELRVLAETARGLHYAHETRDFTGAPLNVVHRDVSPQNVILTYDGQVKLLDFGIAKAVDSENLTQVGLIKGKIEYIAPEQARGDRVDRRADIFALGAMAWEAVTRQRFAGGPNVSAVTKLHKRLTGGEPDVLDIQPEAPEKLVKLVRRALALDPAHRFETAAAFAAEIDDFLDSMNLRPSATTLSERLARPFMPDRARISSVIEEQLKRLGQRGVGSDIPRIDRFDVTISGARIGSDRFGNTDPQLPLGSQEPEPNARARRLRGPAAVATAAIGGALVLGFVLSRGKPALEPVATPTTQQPTAAAHSQPEPTPAPALQPATIAFQVEIDPAVARVTLDETPLSALPFSGKLPKDDRVHSLEASAPGYEKTRVAVTFDRDRSLHLALKRIPEPVAERPTKPHPEPVRREARSAAEPGAVGASAAAPAADSTSAAPGAPLVSRKRVGASIDKTNPYLE